MIDVIFAVFVAACALGLSWLAGRRIALRDAEIARLDAAREADADEAAATYNALVAEIAEFEAESLKWYKSAADGIDGALEHGVRETAARDLRITELEKLVNELRCGDLGAFHDGELPEGRRAAFERHLVTCERCQAGLRDLLYVDLVASASGGRNG